MPGTEDDGNLLSLIVDERGQEVAHTLHPHFKLLMILASRQYLLHHSRIADVPGRSLREFLSGPATTLDGGHRIARMPRECDDAPTAIVVLHFLRHAGEGHAVQILGVGHFDAAQVEAHDGGIVAAGVLHVARILVILPCQTVHRVVLMSVHDALMAQRVESLQQLLGLRLLYRGSLLSATCRQHQCCQRNSH